MVSSNILYNKIDQETEDLSTYENEWPESITNLVKTKYITEFGMLNFPLNLLQVNYSFEIYQLKVIKLLKMGKNHGDIAIFKYYDMM